MASLLNKYPNKLIDQQFNKVLSKFNINESLSTYNYDKIRIKVINAPIKGKVPVDYDKTMFVHFTYCSSMRSFPKQFHKLWSKYFGASPINEIVPVLGTRNVYNLQRQLMHTRLCLQEKKFGFVIRRRSEPFNVF